MYAGSGRRGSLHEHANRTSERLNGAFASSSPKGQAPVGARSASRALPKLCPISCATTAATTSADAVPICMLTLPERAPPHMVDTPARPTVLPSKSLPLMSTWLS